MAKTPKDAKTAPPSGGESPSKPPAAPPAKKPEGETPVSTPSASASPGLKGLAAMHAGEKPVVDNNAGPEKGKTGRPTKSEEEKEAVRKAYEAKRKAQRAQLKAPAKEEKPEAPKYTEAEKKSRIQVNATMMATTTIGIFSGLFGDKFKDGATGNDDKEILESGWVSYFTAKDIVDIPPVLALILSHCSYLLPRISFKAWWEKVFPEKVEKPNVEKPVVAPAVKPREADILLYEPPVGEKVASGAPA